MKADTPNFILLDTNAIIYAIEKKIRLEDAVIEIPGVSRPAVPYCVIRELYGLAKKNVTARIAYQYAKKLEIIETDKYGDDGVIEAAMKTGAMVLTNDERLSRRLRETGIKVAMISGRKILF
ncbi:hypothetical protein [Thermoplasma volcanium GSS1]|uniref:PIN domain-containing protein n=1 Tax=Thermoplasma volcanium (strain ATCC 51530 / DSM 4299 / JCM 9571 / NBRC 15438 / GSS1) TaxID=273116 RepID=Q97AE5_THEVO|nr:PIN domain-containing protein [Thermoplasma volcanium]BAB60007.1 hypothetical protein [Thermoplasma volcanium GSS1]